MNLQNPYAPPAAPIAQSTPDAVAEVRFASKAQRFVNLIVDETCAILFAVLVGGVLGVFGDTDKPNEGMIQLLVICLFCGYYIALEALTGRTIGKLVTGTKVVSADGRPPSFGQIVGRTAARFLPFEALSFFGSNPGWHDGLSRTRVVRTR
jgi:uncharacterized RDD family membrane protein YckC